MTVRNHIVRAGWRVVIAVVGLGLTGCNAFPAVIHANYEELRPTVVAITPPENKTLHEDLRAFRTAGPLQSLLLDGREMDILLSFRKGAEDALRNLGYRATLADDDAAASNADARFDLNLWRWRIDSGFDQRGFNAEFEVLLTRNEGGELLYQRRFPYRVTSRGNAPITAGAIDSGIRSAVKAALYRLPRAANE